MLVSWRDYGFERIIWSGCKVSELFGGIAKEKGLLSLKNFDYNTHLQPVAAQKPTKKIFLLPHQSTSSFKHSYNHHEKNFITKRVSPAFAYDAYQSQTSFTMQNSSSIKRKLGAFVHTRIAFPYTSRYRLPTGSCVRKKLCNIERDVRDFIWKELIQFLQWIVTVHHCMFNGF